MGGNQSGQAEAAGIVPHDFLEFSNWLSAECPGRSAVHLVGFNKKMMPDLNNAALKHIEAYDIITWAGDAYDENGFTAVVPSFLRKGDNKIAIAFRKKGSIQGFTKSWRSAASEFPGRIHVVECDVDPPAIDLLERFGLQDEGHYAEQLPEKVRPYYWLGRLQIINMRTKHIVGIGGGGCAKLEVEAAFHADPALQIAVFAQVRRLGKATPAREHKELVDFATDNICDRRITFIPRTDDHYVLSVRFDKNNVFEANRCAEIMAELLGEENCFCPNSVTKSGDTACVGSRDGSCLGKSPQFWVRNGGTQIVASTGNDPTDDVCWAGSFRWRLEGKCRRGRARHGKLPIMIQLVEGGTLSKGQEREKEMAEQVGNAVIEINISNDPNMPASQSTCQIAGAVAFGVGVTTVGTATAGAVSAAIFGSSRPAMQRRQELIIKLREKGVLVAHAREEDRPQTQPDDSIHGDHINLTCDRQAHNTP